jgi:hypothetical protein
MSREFGGSASAQSEAVTQQALASGTVPRAHLFSVASPSIHKVSALTSAAAFQSLDPQQQRLWRAVLPSLFNPLLLISRHSLLIFFKRLGRVGPGFFAQLRDMGFDDWL